MERAIKNLLIVFVLIAGCITSNAQLRDEFSNFAPTVYPDRIMLTIPGDPGQQEPGGVLAGIFLCP